MTQERGEVRDDDFDYVVRHFEPPGSDEATIICDTAQPLDGWIELIVRGVAVDASHLRTGP